eukprot:gene25330-biopygen1013
METLIITGPREGSLSYIRKEEGGKKGEMSNIPELFTAFLKISPTNVSQPWHSSVPRSSWLTEGQLMLSTAPTSTTEESVTNAAITACNHKTTAIALCIWQKAQNRSTNLLTPSCRVVFSWRSRTHRLKLS